MVDNIKIRPNPCLLEINTGPFLGRLIKKYNRPLTLSSIPDEEWQEISRLGFDLVWLMGIWQRSPFALRSALSEASLIKEYNRVLPDWTNADIGGSPYAIYDYRPDSDMGTPGELVKLRQNLNRNGLGLILDFVPNHIARDHQWVLSYPGRFIHGSKDDFKAHPDWFFSPAPDIYVSHGRDPYFPPWTDTAQVNIFSPALRQAFIRQLGRISEIADGIRCDMAMLVLNNVFEQVWGKILRNYPRPQTEFWAEAITAVKHHRQGFVFLGEVYWNLEKELIKLGFDFTYDKNLYDRLFSANILEISQHLNLDINYQAKMARFIENHDENRAANVFGTEKSLAAATVIMTLPGLRFIYEGQVEGKKIKLPVQLKREPDEPADKQIITCYKRLLAAVNQPVLHTGEWHLSNAETSTGKPHPQMLSWYWRLNEETVLVLINYGAEDTQAVIRLPEIPGPRPNTIRDLLTENLITTSSTDNELNLSFKPWQAYLLSY